MKKRYYIILVTAVAAGTALASADEVNVRWSRGVVNHAASTQKPQLQKLAGLLGRVQVNVKTGKSAHQGQVSAISRQSPHKQAANVSRGDTRVRVLVNSRRLVSRERSSFVSVVVGGQSDSAHKPTESAVQKQGSAVQKVRPVQKPNYVGGQLRPFQR